MGKYLKYVDLIKGLHPEKCCLWQQGGRGLTEKGPEGTFWDD